MSAVDFAWRLAKLHAGADREQLALRESDHNQPYRGKKIPLLVTISNYHCNLQCLHCHSENDNAKQDVPTERMLRLIDEIADAGGVKVSFAGGEPLMRNDIGDILRRCKSRGLVVSVVTNGWYVARNLEALKGIDVLFLSLDGNREVHDRVRGAGSFDKFEEAVQVAQSNGIPVAALTTVMSGNMACLKEMGEIIAKRRLHWMVSLVQTRFTKRSEQELTRDEVRRAADFLSAARNVRTTRRYLRFLVEGRPMERCFAGIGYCSIAPDGMVYPCAPAIFDHEGYDGTALRREDAGSFDPGPYGAYRGVSVIDKTFGEAFDELRLYRRSCGSCYLACHAETNYIIEFSWESISQCLKLMRPAA